MVDLVGERTLRDLLEERERRYQGKKCLICEDAQGLVKSLSYQELLDNVGAAARGFSALGIKKGDAIVVHLANSPEFLISWFGLAWLGAILVPSNTANTAFEIGYVFERSEAVGIVTSPDYLQAVESAMVGKTGIKILARTDETFTGWYLLSELMVTGGEVPRPPLRSEDILEMIFTSGTTSRPKGVLLTHANALRSGERSSRSFALQDSDRCLTALPAFHVNAQSMAIMGSLTVGATCIMLEQYSASKFWTQVRNYEATATSLVAMQVRTLLAQPPSEGDSNHQLRRVFYAINVTNHEKEEFERRFNVELINGYGLSEAMTIVTVAPTFGEKRWPSIGLPAFDRQVKIVDENGDEVPPNTVGEIVVSGIPGRTLMVGYFKDPEATAETLKDGWLHTADNAYADEQGYLYFFDRKKDVIKRAGENISATEVEFVLVEHPLVAEAAVIGVPDDIRDEAVKAYVVLVEGKQLEVGELLDHCRERMASFKVPSIIEIRESLPKTSIGKVEKKVLRAESSDNRGPR